MKNRLPTNKNILVKIGDAAKSLGVSIDTVRRWEKSGKISPIRTPGGTRLYSLSILQKINSSLDKNSFTKENIEQNSLESGNQNNQLLNETEIIKPPLLTTTRSILDYPHLTPKKHEFEANLSQNLGKSRAGKHKIYAAAAIGYIIPILIIVTGLISASYMLQPKATKQFFAKQTSDIRHQTSDEEQQINKIAVQNDILGVTISPLDITSYISDLVKKTVAVAISPFNEIAQKVAVELASAPVSINNVVTPTPESQNPESPPQPQPLEPFSFRSKPLAYSGQVLAEATSSASQILEINADTEISGTINGLTLKTNPDGFSIAGGSTTPSTLTASSAGIVLTSGNSILTLNGGGALNLSSLVLSATTNQLTFQGTSAKGILTWTPTSSDKTITLPNSTTTLIGTDTTDTLKNKTIKSGDSNTISGSYTGITGLGTISTGEWNGTKIAVGYGGTGAGSAADARTNLGAAASGANSDITSLTGLTTALAATRGGTAQTTYTTGDILYASASNTLSKLSVGTSGQVLTVSSGIPAWATNSSGVTSLNSLTGALTISGTSNQITVAASDTTVTLSTPQSIGTSSSPSFAALTLSNTTNQLVLGTTSTVTISSTAPSASRTFTIPDFGSNDSFVGLAATQSLTNKTLTSPTINTPAISGGTATALTGLAIRSTGTGAFDLTFANTENLSAGRTLTLKVNDAARTIDLAGNLTTTTAAVTLAANAAGSSVTLPASGTLATLAGSEILTNKTLTSPTIGTSPTAAGATWADLGAVTTIDINGGTIDGVTIGASSAGAATFTTVNKLTLTAPTTSAVLTIADGKTLTVSNSLTLAGTDAKTLNIGSNSLTFSTSGDSTLTLPTSGTVTALGNTSTGSGSTLVLSTTPTFTTSIIVPLIIGSTSANGTLTLEGNNTTGNTAGNANIIFKVGDSAGTTAMTIANNGNIGIGSTAPADKLDVRGNIAMSTNGSKLYALDNATTNKLGSNRFAYKIPLTLATDSTVGGVGVAYTYTLVLNSTTTPTASTVYNASQSGGNDFRVAYNGTEIQRTVDKFTSTEIYVHFPVQAAIAASGSDANYTFYYGNLALAAQQASDYSGATYNLRDSQLDDGTSSNWTSSDANVIAMSSDTTNFTEGTASTQGALGTGANVGAFATTSQAQLPTTKYDEGAVTATIGGTTYIYVIGGATGAGGAPTSTAYKSQINTSGDALTFDTASQGQLPAVLSAIQYNTVSATIGGTSYVYVVGGSTTGSAQVSTVYKSQIDTSANLGAFATTSQGQLLAALNYNAAVTAAIAGTTYIYSIGGFVGGPTNSSAVYKAQINTTGDVQAFATTSQAQLPQTLSIMPAVTATIGGTTYIYVLGGNNASSRSTVYKAQIDTSANVGAFDTTSQAQLPSVSAYHHASLATIGGTNYIYVSGLANALSAIYRAQIDTSANVGAFATTSQAQLPEIRAEHNTLNATIGASTYFYVLGGWTTGNTSTVYKSTLGVDPTATTITKTITSTDLSNANMVTFWLRSTDTATATGIVFEYSNNGTDYTTAGGTISLSSANSWKQQFTTLSGTRNTVTKIRLRATASFTGNFNFDNILAESTSYTGVITPTLGSSTGYTNNLYANSEGLGVLGVNYSSGSSGGFNVYNGGTTTNLQVSLLGNVVLGSAALATTATDGFLYLTTTAGLPTGTPTAYTGRSAVLYDTTNNKLCAYNSAWKCSAALTDYAEWAPAKDTEPGDVVSVTSQPNTINDPEDPFMLGKSSIPYDTKIIGVISKYAEEANSANGYKKSPDYHAVALAGRVPVNVSNKNGAIHKGDLLTSSDIPGVAMKATSGGYSLGTALEDFDRESGTILAFINPKLSDPQNILANLTIDSDGNLITPKIKVEDISLLAKGSIVKDILGNQQISTASAQLFTTNLTSQIASVSARLASQQAQLADLESRIKNQESISSATQALPQKKIRVNQTELGFLRVRQDTSVTSPELAQVQPDQIFDVVDEKNGWYQIEYKQDALGWIKGNYVTVTSTGKYIEVKPTELGFLRVRNKPFISSEELARVLPDQIFEVNDEKNGWYLIEYKQDQLGWIKGSYTNLLDKLSAISRQTSATSSSQLTDYRLQSTASPSASPSAALTEIGSQKSVDDLNLTPPALLLATDSARLTNLSVASEATFSGKLVGYNLSVQNIFKSLGETFLGKTTIAGDLSVDGTLSITGNSLSSLSTLYIQNATLSDKLDIFNGKVTIDNQGKVSVQKLEVSSKTLGTAALPAGKTAIFITNPLINDNSKIFVTATTATPQPLYISDQKSGNGFEVSISTTSSKDIKFNWWIVDSKEDF